MLHRLGAISGLIAVGLLVWSSAVFSGPQSSPEDSDAAVVTELTEIGADSDQAMFLAMFALPFLVAFGGFVAERFRRRGVPEWLGSTFLGGTVLFGVASMILGGVGQMTSVLGGIPGAEGIARFVVVFGWNGTNLFIPALLAIGGTAVVGSLLADALPRWVGIGAVLVVLSSLTPWIGVFVLTAWVAVTSVVLTAEAPAELVDA